MRPRAQRVSGARAKALLRTSMLAAILAGESSSCAPRREAAPSRADVAGTLEVRFAGCAAVHRGPTCLLADERRLRLWVPGPAGACTLACRTDRGQASCSARAPSSADASARDGCAYEVTVPSGATSLCVERTTIARTANAPPTEAPASFCLALAPAAPDPALDALERLRHEAPAAADRRLVALLDQERDPDRRARAGALRARIALAGGDTTRARQGLRASFEAALAAGRLSDAAHDGFALAHLLVTEALRFEEARDLLREIGLLLPAFPAGRAEHAYYTGLLAAQTGDVRAALAAFRLAMREAEELDQPLLESYAETQLAVQLAAVGRTEEAFTLAAGVVSRRRARGRDPAELPCNRAAPEVDLAWIALLGWRSQAPRPAPSSAGALSEHTLDPAPLLAAARAALEREGCQDVARWQNTRLNEALFATARGELGLAHARLDELRDEGPPPSSYLAVWEAEACGRLALREGRTDAARVAFAREATLARAAGLAEGVLRGETGRGRAELAEGRRGLALAHLRAARAAFEQLFVLVPLGAGRHAFMQSHEESARFLVDALARAGHAREAFAIARLDRARGLATVAQAKRLAALTPEERARWEGSLAAYRAERAALEAEALHDAELPRDALVRTRAARRLREEAARAHLDEAYARLGAGALTTSASLAWPQEGEVYLGYAPGDGVWWGFLATANGGVRARELARGPVPRPGDGPGRAASEEARRLLGPFAPALNEARRVRLFPHPLLDELDLRALPFPADDGSIAAHARPLGEARAVDEGVDLPARAPTARVDDGVLLVVTNPTEDLPATRAEGRVVAEALGSTRASPGRSPPRVVRLEAAVATRTHVLDALPGASLFHYAGHAFHAGTDGLDSALPLAAQTSLTVGDVLALPRAPEVVTLAACEAAGSETGSRATLPLGIAEAFLAAGARVVLAPIRAVNDELARAYMSALYGALATTEYWRDPAFSLAHAAGVADEVVRRTRPSAGASLFKVLAVPAR